MRPLRVATLHSQKDRSFLTRCHQPLSWLQTQCAIEWLEPMKAWEADVVFMHRQTQPGALAVVRSLQRNGIRVVADLDEALLESQPRVRELCETVDAVVVSNGSVGSSLSVPESRIAVCPSGIDLALWRKLPAPKTRDRVQTVGFVAAASHASNLEILRPALAKLAPKFKELDIRFVCFGFRPPWLSGVVPGAEMIEACRAEEYPLRLVRLGLDVALAPLTNSASNRNLSPLSISEYALAGAVTIATNVEPYGPAIQDGSSGLLVDNKPESWIQGVSKLIRNQDLRRQLLDGARQAAEANDLSVTATSLLEALERTQPNRDREFFAFPRTQTETRKDVDVVIPIYNAPELTRRAIEATLPELNANDRLILVDDASPDPAMVPLLDEYQGRPWVTIHRSDENRGFVGTCNLAVLEMARPDADVILLNSDARPMHGFIRRLADTAGSNPAIGTVTAVSNNGSIASVLNLSDSEGLAREVENPLVAVPTGVGHLMYIKREVIREFGLFDMAFSPGYGEEVDLCQRSSDRYTHVLDTGCWCWHEGSASFQGNKSQLRQDHDALINKRYPHYEFEVHSYLTSDPLRSYRRRTLAATRDPRPRVLQVVHSYEAVGGTEKHVQDLEAELSNQFMSFVAAPCVTAPNDPLKLYSGTVPLDARSYGRPGWPLTSSEVPANDQEWSSILRELKPDLIHFHHLLNHPLSLLSKLTDSGIPVIVSIHDYYFLCPDYTLQHCPGVHSCDTCFPERFKGPAEYQRLRRVLLGGSLRKAAVLVAPSHAAANLVREVYPDLNIRVIPHGIRPVAKLAKTPSSKLRFGMIGYVAPVKGIEVILKAWPLVAQKSDAELHIYGASDPRYVEQIKAAGIHYHGAYREGDLPRILSEIDVGLLPSQQPETFCYALTEFFAGGVPVVGSDYGNVADQIVSGVNGYKVQRGDPRAWAEMISALIQDPSLGKQIAQGVRPPDSIRGMADNYRALYEEVLQRAVRGTGDRVLSPVF
jgi:glycosyltransferase involved in cell wall biosynthesis